MRELAVTEAGESRGRSRIRGKRSRSSRWRFHLTTLGGVVLALGLLSPDVARGQNSDFDWRGTLSEGRSIEIKGVNGAIRAVAAVGNEVQVSATKKARKSNPDEVTFEVVKHQDGVTICAMYPGRGGRPNECRPGDGGRMNVQNNDVDVEFTVHVPRGVHFVGRTVNGDVQALSLSSDAHIYTVNGGVRLATLGYATASTVNGSIDAKIGHAEWAGAVEFKTVNGGITLELPATLGAEFSAQTVNGDISTDFPIQMQGRFTPRKLQGTIGEGGPRRLEVKTVNGSIRLRKAS